MEAAGGGARRGGAAAIVGPFGGPDGGGWDWEGSLGFGSTGWGARSKYVFMMSVIRSFNVVWGVSPTARWLSEPPWGSQPTLTSENRHRFWLRRQP